MSKRCLLLVIVLTVLTAALFPTRALAVKFDFTGPKLMDEDKVLQENASVEQSEEPEITRPKIEPVENARDPFKPALEEEQDKEVPEQEEKLPELTVQGLIWGSSLPQAIVNNKVVKVGDKIEGAEVVSIDKQGVTVLFANKEHKLSSPAALGPQLNAAKTKEG
jgi:hypothetical protein